MKPTILILEDNFLLSEDLAWGVREELDANPVVAARASDALKLITPDTAFAFLDVEVLDGTSFPVAERLKEMDIPFVFVSGSRPDQVPENLRKAPFVQKPAASRSLMQLAKSLGSTVG